ncbi:MAG: dTMP kinase [Candidatus Marsarchaeota archaeon]|nr:dTMP kinase [Candidatus Marsarchaeota archaeon]
MKRGAFIVLEGLDGSGISTQATYLETRLRQQGYKTLLTKEPTTGLIGGMIRAALKENWNTSFKSLQLLFCADRARHLEDEIEPALDKDRIVICDRYMFSTLAYGFAAGVDTHWLFNVNREFRMPDLTIFIDISPDISMSRIGSGREKRELFEKRETLGKVRKAYLNLAKRFRFRMVNGEQDVAETSREVADIVDKFLARR